MKIAFNNSESCNLLQFSVDCIFRVIYFRELSSYINAYKEDATSVQVDLEDWVRVNEWEWIIAMLSDEERIKEKEMMKCFCWFVGKISFNRFR